MTTEVLQEQSVRPSRRMPWHIAARVDESLHPEPSPETLTAREWLVTNGLGGYASGTLSGVPTRRYHGLLIAALPAPIGRTLMLGQVSEVVRFVLEKRVLLLHMQNTAYVQYRLVEGPGLVRLEIHPLVHFRPHDAPVSTPLAEPFVVKAVDGQYEICSSWAALPPLRLRLIGANPTFTVTSRKIEGLFYGVEHGRGYESVGDLWAPGFFAADLD